MRDRHLYYALDEVRDALDEAEESLRLADSYGPSEELSDSQALIGNLTKLLDATDLLGPIHATMRAAGPAEIAKYPKLLRRLSRVTLAALEQIRPVLLWSKDDFEDEAEEFPFVNKLPAGTGRIAARDVARDPDAANGARAHP